MKVTVDVECTPDEARAFLGLPDVKPMQDALLHQIQERMASNLAAMDPESLVKAWLPAGVQGLEHIQKMFWSQFSGAGRKDKTP